jgi:hypothetical protein
MSAFQELQRWYQSQCNGDWEHTNGVKIDTLDNLGWCLTIDLESTNLANRHFTKIDRLSDSAGWFVCEVRNLRFEGRGGPLMLEELVTIFLAWASEVRNA